MELNKFPATAQQFLIYLARIGYIELITIEICSYISSKQLELFAAFSGHDDKDWRAIDTTTMTWVPLTPFNYGVPPRPYIVWSAGSTDETAAHDPTHPSIGYAIALSQLDDGLRSLFQHQHEAREIELYDFAGELYGSWGEYQPYGTHGSQSDEHWTLVDFTSRTKLPWAPPESLYEYC